MKAAYLLAIAAALLLAGCTTPSSGIKDCGSDVTCFSEAAAVCSPARLTMTQTQEGVGQSMMWEVRGYSGTSCKFYYKHLGFQSSDASQAQQVQFANALMKDKEMECMFPPNVSTSYMVGTTNGAPNFVAAMDLMKKYCNGSLLEVMNSLTDKSPGYGTENGVTNCGTDMTCFSQAMINCTPAKVTMTQPNEADGSSISISIEVRGQNAAEACRVYYRYSDVTLPAGASPEAQAARDMLLGKDMECAFPMSKVSTAMSTTDTLKYCSGPMVDLLNSFS